MSLFLQIHILVGQQHVGAFLSPNIDLSSYEKSKF